MSRICGALFRGSLSGIEKELPRVKEIFDLVDQDELTQAESIYLPKKEKVAALASNSYDAEAAR
ncbi:hypothetical protein NMB96_01870 [Xanthomonas hortorum]|uniref:hypothetical protein n=1 Tax=Xanthomonas hortorum TaxID=56454 RepID=UPI0020CEF13F|nr:hypothetical protein [Xanthomonas hortorum]UTS73633.1 hypothetical protein NMB96_01870 [Xanthomonas hortorum]